MGFFLLWAKRSLGLFFEYDTPRIVHIESKWIGVTSRLVQVLILSYILGYVLLYQKGYQKFDSVQSAVTTKVKGVIYTNFSDQELLNVLPPEYRPLYNRIWDVTDYVVPPTENQAFFITTNVIITPNQTKSQCPEAPSVPGAKCRSDSDCSLGRALDPTGHGVQTGKCDPSMRTCVINAWCPVEKDVPPLKDKGLLEESKKFTVLIKNQIEFPYFGKRRNNILTSSNSSYLRSCTYHNETDPFCPVFVLDDIVSSAGENYTAVSKNGCIISIIIQWDCDLDYDFMSHCRPTYAFKRLDNPNTKLAPGWNFRHSEYYNDNLRTLYKSYGILFDIEVNGRARKFNLIPTFLNIGSGLALLGITTVICDILILYCAKDKVLYRDKKYLQVRGRDAYNIDDETEVIIDQDELNVQDDDDALFDQD